MPRQKKGSVTLSPEQVEQLKQLLAGVYVDAAMALDECWNPTDEGFEEQQVLTSKMYSELFNEPIEEHSAWAEYQSEKEEDEADN